ncbi:MAG: formate--tetrahydrofolate ligase, partial [Minwuiales bacterium]|nr:formate--tetrahydrofolate ligase [Minwuiales bacterium]
MADVRSDIDIAQAADMMRIGDIAAKLDIGTDDIVPFGHHKAKLPLDYIARLPERPDGKLILVTAITPTPAGE